MSKPLMTPERRERLLRDTRRVPLFLYHCGAARFHDDGDCVGVVLRWWHPLAWLAFLILVAFTFCAYGVVGVKELTTEAFNFYVTSSYFQKHPDELEWL